MNYKSSCIINNTPVKQEPTAPKTKSANCIRESQPQRHKHHPSLDIHPPQQRSGQQNQRDRRKHALIPHHGRHGIERLNHRRLNRTIVVMVRGRRQLRLPDQELLA